MNILRGMASLPFLVLVACAGLQAQEVNISGKVVDGQAASAPLQGVRAGIARLNLYTQTKADGTFSLIGSTAISGIMGSSSPRPPRIQAGMLFFQLDRSLPVTAECFDAQGKMFFSKNLRNAPIGRHRIPLKDFAQSLADGIVIIRLKMGENASLWRLMIMDGLQIAFSRRIQQAEIANSPALAKIAAASKDTVSFTLAGYIPRQIFVDSLMAGNIGTITLQKEATGNPISIAMSLNSTQQAFGAVLLETSLREINRRPVCVDIAQATGNEEITVQVVDSASSPAIKSEGFQISNSAGKITIKAIDQRGAMYGMQEVSDQITMNGLGGVPARTVNARFPFRAIKVNLPWSSYRTHSSLQLHTETMRDLKFWESFLDMMVENRFNAITLWNEHPFPYMIRATNFLKACSFADAELAVWKNFYSSIFRMAKERGIESYIVHWNIFVSQGYHDNYSPTSITDVSGTSGAGASNATDDRYLKESVTQLINEYPDLTGLGVTLGEAMDNMTAQQREDWLLRTEVAGIKAANRKIKFIHRAPMYTTDATVETACRNAIDGITDVIPPLEFEIKFNWSHAHSTPRLIKIHGGAPTGRYWNPIPTNYRIDWMARNEDFFILRWGQPDFIRQHIAMNGQTYVNGYFIGSECYYPATDYIHVTPSPHVNWKYAFERQWLWYKEWGRLLYDPLVPDKVFELYFDRRYGQGVGAPMVKAFKLASDAELRFASMIDFTWDFTLYAEGFGNPNFVTISGLMNAGVFDDRYYSVGGYVGDSLAARLSAAKIKPLKLADTLQKNGEDALALVAGIAGASPTLQCEIADVQAWAYYSLYFAHKLRAAVALRYYTASAKKYPADKTNGIALLQSAKTDWQNLVNVTKPHQLAVPLIHISGNFSWERYLPNVDADIVTAQGY